VENDVTVISGLAKGIDSRRMFKMIYHFKTHKEDNGFWAECVELPGCLSQAETCDELIQACEESLNLFLEEPKDSKVVFPLPNELLGNDSSLLGIEVEPEIALAVLLRYH
jgi:predicted RNase H-like HicB family nuclease